MFCTNLVLVIMFTMNDKNWNYGTSTGIQYALKCTRDKWHATKQISTPLSTKTQVTPFQNDFKTRNAFFRETSMLIF